MTYDEIMNHPHMTLVEKIEELYNHGFEQDGDKQLESYIAFEVDFKKLQTVLMQMHVDEAIRFLKLHDEAYPYDISKLTKPKEIN